MVSETLRKELDQFIEELHDSGLFKDFGESSRGDNQSKNVPGTKFLFQ